MADNLHMLADKLGIARHFSDAGLKKTAYDVDDDILKFFCKAYGYKADTEQQAQESLEKFADLSWKTMLPAIVIAVICAFLGF